MPGQSFHSQPRIIVGRTLEQAYPDERGATHPIAFVGAIVPTSNRNQKSYYAELSSAEFNDDQNTICFLTAGFTQRGNFATTARQAIETSYTV
jgi:hypothetical protein